MLHLLWPFFFSIATYGMRPAGVVSVEHPKVITDLLVHLVRHGLVALEMGQVLAGGNLEHVRVHGNGGGLVKGHQQNAIRYLKKSWKERAKLKT